MRVLYVAPRFHTNQIPIIKGWKNNHDEAMVISQYRGYTEDYGVIEPVELGYSPVFRGILYFYKKLKKGKTNGPMNAFQAQYGWPSLHKVCNEINNFKPDVMILRDRSVYNICFYLLGKAKGIPSILYNQTPFWEEERNLGLFHKGMRLLSPKYRMTPVLGTKGKGKSEDPKAYYIPFVMEPFCASHEREYFYNNKINLLCVGKFEKRKNQIMLLQAMKNLYEYDLHLTLVGEAKTKEQTQFKESVVNKVKELRLEKCVDIKLNLTMEQVYEEYTRADLFVLPSTGEFASVAQLEAMSCSVPVICSDTNGTACYIAEGENGYLFRDGDQAKLEESIRKILTDRNNIIKFGENSYKLICNEYSFAKYKESIQTIIGEMS